jgi:adenylate kinase
VCDACGKALFKREDDDEEIIRARLQAYHFMTEPLASYYRQRGVLLAVKGEQSIASLYEELVRKVTKLGFVAK